MTVKIDLIEKLDELFGTILTEVTTQKDAGVGNEKITLDQKLEVFKEGVRYAAVKNKLPDPGDNSTKAPVEGRLGQIKRGLGRRS